MLAFQTYNQHKITGCYVGSYPIFFSSQKLKKMLWDNAIAKLKRMIKIQPVKYLLYCLLIMFIHVYNVIQQYIVSKILTLALFFSPYPLPPFKKKFWILKWIINP